MDFMITEQQSEALRRKQFLFVGGKIHVFFFRANFDGGFCEKRVLREDGAWTWGVAVRTGKPGHGGGGRSIQEPCVDRVCEVRARGGLPFSFFTFSSIFLATQLAQHCREKKADKCSKHGTGPCASDASQIAGHSLHLSSGLFLFANLSSVAQCHNAFFQV